MLVRRLARGGMAEIFLARREGPEGFSRELVVKRILPHLGADPEFVAMFLDEARIAARLAHPNVVHVYDFGEADGQYYLAMELVRGVDLGALIQRAAELARAEGRLGAVPPHHAAKLLSFACEGLAHAHALCDAEGRPLRLVHRDVTPSNVLLSFDGAVKVADFGIAKADRMAVGSSAEHTRSGVVKGKRTYLSPEQSAGAPLDHRSDLFNVGILLYEACTGVPLFPFDGYRAAMDEVRRGRLPGEQWLAGTPPALVATVRRALAPHPEQRHPDALALRAELEAFLRSWPEPSDAVELGAYVRALFPDVVQRDRTEARAAGTVPALTAELASALRSPGGGLGAHAPWPPGSAPPLDAGALSVHTPQTTALLGAEAAPDVDDAVTRAVVVPASLRAGPPSAAPRSAGHDAPPSRGHARPRAPAVAWLAVAGVGGLVVAGGFGAAFLGSRHGDGDAAAMVAGTADDTADDAVAASAWTAASSGAAGAHQASRGEGGGARGAGSLGAGAGVPVARAADGLAGPAGGAALGDPPGGPGPAEPRIDDGEPLAVDVRARDGRGARGRGQGRAAARGGRPPHRAVDSRAASDLTAGGRAGGARPAASHAATGRLTISTTPWSEVYLGDRSLGTTPLANVALPVGSHTLVLRAPGRAERRVRVSIERDRETRVREVL
jgi:serine/threonine-protein kinase